MSDELVIETNVQPTGTVIRLKGNAGINSGQTLEHALTRLCAGRPSLVVFDLSELHLIASLVMGQMVAVQRSLGRTGGKMRLAAVPELVMGSLRHSRLDSLFQCFPTVEAALVV